MITTTSSRSWRFALILGRDANVPSSFSASRTKLILDSIDFQTESILSLIEETLLAVLLAVKLQMSDLLLVYNCQSRHEVDS